MHPIALGVCYFLCLPKISKVLIKITANTAIPMYTKKRSVSHLLHTPFLPGRCGSLCHPCFVNPAM